MCGTEETREREREQNNRSQLEIIVQALRGEIVVSQESTHTEKHKNYFKLSEFSFNSCVFIMLFVYLLFQFIVNACAKFPNYVIINSPYEFLIQGGFRSSSCPCFSLLFAFTYVHVTV